MIDHLLSSLPNWVVGIGIYAIGSLPLGILVGRALHLANRDLDRARAEAAARPIHHDLVVIDGDDGMPSVFAIPVVMDEIPEFVATSPADTVLMALAEQLDAAPMEPAPEPAPRRRVSPRSRRRGQHA